MDESTRPCAWSIQQSLVSRDLHIIHRPNAVASTNNCWAWSGEPQKDASGLKKGIVRNRTPWGHEHIPRVSCGSMKSRSQIQPIQHLNRYHRCLMIRLMKLHRTMLGEWRNGVTSNYISELLLIQTNSTVCERVEDFVARRYWQPMHSSAIAHTLTPTNLGKKPDYNIKSQMSYSNKLNISAHSVCLHNSWVLLQRFCYKFIECQSWSKSGQENYYELRITLPRHSRSHAMRREQITWPAPCPTNMFEIFGIYIITYSRHKSIAYIFQAPSISPGDQYGTGRGVGVGFVGPIAGEIC